MATSYTQLKNGSSGSSVKELQKLLNQNGYSLDEDGVFGNKTLAAVKNYQTKNGLTVDGIVGNNTWTSLTNTNTSSGSKSKSTSDTSKGFSYDDFTYGDYKESDTVSQAYAALQSQLAAKPGEYSSQWQSQINDIIDRIMNREDFSYDVNSDALYQQYKDQYTNLGKLAMADTMGQAAAMTGGYGNSYASTVGNQAYQSYLSQLNEVVPELYAMALDKYSQEGDELYNNYSLLADQESQDYGRYQDEYNQWLTERDYLAGRYDSERSYDYSKYTDDRNFAYGEYSDDKSYAYDEYRNAIADEQWQKQYDESVRQYNEQMAITQEQWDLQKQQYNDSSKSYSGTTSSGTSYNNGSLTNSQVKELQAALGVDADGYYGPQTKEATGGLSAAEAYAKYVGGTVNADESETDNSEDILSGVRQSILNKVGSFSTNKDLENYLNGLVADRELTDEQADILYERNINDVADFDARTWTAGDDGGWYIGSINDNATVIDQYKNEYRLDDLIDQLVKSGMNKKEAKQYVKKLQDDLW